MWQSTLSRSLDMNFQIALFSLLFIKWNSHTSVQEGVNSAAFPRHHRQILKSLIPKNNTANKNQSSSIFYLMGVHLFCAWHKLVVALSYAHPNTCNVLVFAWFWKAMHNFLSFFKTHLTLGTPSKFFWFVFTMFQQSVTLKDGDFLKYVVQLVSWKVPVLI